MIIRTLISKNKFKPKIFTNSFSLHAIAVIQYDYSSAEPIIILYHKILIYIGLSQIQICLLIFHQSRKYGMFATELEITVS